VIVYLVSPRPADVADLCHSVRLLHANFFQVFARCYDVIVFHDGLSDAQISRIKVFVCVCVYVCMHVCVYV
jgi:flagellar biosynthesis protein FliR